jgi:mediator of RNA polymerase II transcription subunit 16
MLSGSVRWCLDLMSWIIDSLLNPEDKSIFKSISTGQSIDLEELNSRLHASNNVALHLLFSSATRGFLTVICRRLNNLDFASRKGMSTAAQHQAATSMHLAQPVISNALRMAYTSIATLISSSIVQIHPFEAFLTSISASVRDAYTTAGLTSLTSQASQQQPHSRPTESSKNLAEQNMLFGGPLPAELKPVMTHLFTSLLPTLRSGVDLAKLYFHDFSLLALDPMPSASTSSSQALATSVLNTPPQNAGAANERITRTIDIFQRIPIVVELEGGESGGSAVNRAERGVPMPTKRWRRCARCAAVMEDVASQRPAVQFLIAQQRRCFCGGNWNLITGKQVVA